MTEHNVTMAEHGAKRNLLYLSCSCGAESGPHRGYQAACRRAERHVQQAALAYAMAGYNLIALMAGRPA